MRLLWWAARRPCHTQHHGYVGYSVWPKPGRHRPAPTTSPRRLRYCPKQKPSLAEHLGEAGIGSLIERFMSGVTKRDLAAQYGYSVSSVERLLRERGVRL